jgi:hypothetical protein
MEANAIETHSHSVREKAITFSLASPFSSADGARIPFSSYQILQSRSIKDSSSFLRPLLAFYR